MKIIIEDQVLIVIFAIFMAFTAASCSCSRGEELTQEHAQEIHIYSHPDAEKMPRRWLYPERTEVISEIVVHSTDNDSIYADAAWHDHYLDTTHRKASWHFSVDPEQVIMHMDPARYISWHASNAKVNSRSIGIEICQNDTQNPQLMKNAISLVRHLMVKYNIQKVSFHDEYAHHKNCPQIMDDTQRKIFLSHLKNVGQ